MRSATCRRPCVEPKLRAEDEAVLREGESLPQIVEEVVVVATVLRRVLAELITRGEAAIER